MGDRNPRYRDNDRGNRSYGSGGGGHRRDHGGAYRGNNFNRDNRGYNNRYNDRNQEPEHQRSFVGKKRGREDEAPTDPRKVLVTKLMNLCERSQDERTTDEAQIEDALKLCKREIHHRSDNLLELLLEAAVEVPNKTAYYALLLGLLNIDEHDFVSKLVERANDEFNMALAAANRDSARLLLRFFVALVAVNVLQPSGVVSLMDGLVETALSTADSGQDPAGYTWQPWTDYLVYIVAMALPWGGKELMMSNPSEMNRLMDNIDSYMERRPIKEDAEFKPFFQPRDENDMAARSDSGGGTFLPQLWDAVKDCHESQGWKVISIPQVHASYEVKLAAAQACELPHIQIPGTPAIITSDQPPVRVAAALRQAFPPRGGIRLLDKQHTEATRPRIERYIAEEYMLDMMTCFDGDRVQLVRKLTSGMCLPFAYTNLLAEVLFGQVLTLPRPRLHQIAYSTVMVDLCKFPKFEFPKALSACVRECFNRMPNMDPELRTRLVNLLSYHLSNFEYQWPWDRWEWVLSEAEDHPQRQFCKELVHRLLRLSFWERITAVLPAKFQELLGPKPEVPLLPGQQQLPAPVPPPPPPAVLLLTPGVHHVVAGAQGVKGQEQDQEMQAPEQDQDQDQEAKAEAPAGDAAVKAEAVDMETAEGGAQEDGQGDAEEPSGAEKPADEDAAMEGDGQGVAEEDVAMEQQEKDKEKEKEVPVDDQLAGELLQEIRNKATVAQVLNWLETRGVEEAVGEGTLGAVKVVAKALLAAGSKSPSHLNVALERYSELLRTLLGKGGSAGQVTLLEQSAQFYKALPQKVMMVVDRLMSLRLVEAQQVSHWVFTQEIPANLASSMPSSSAWELMYYAIDRTFQRPKEVQEKVKKYEEEVAMARQKAREASDEAAEVSKELEALPEERQDKRLQAHGCEAAEKERKLLEQAGLFQQTLDFYRSQVDDSEREPVAALLAAYRDFTQLISSMSQDVEDGPVANLDLLYANLRSFARRYLGETASLSEQLEQELQGPGQPSRIKETIQSVVHGLL